MLKAAAKPHNIYYRATECAIHLTYCGSAIGIFWFHSVLSSQDIPINRSWLDFPLQ
jgi:hypothetical protein